MRCGSHDHIPHHPLLMAAPDRITITHQDPMTIPTPRAALEQLLARLDQTTDKDGPVPAWMDSYCTAVQVLKAEPDAEALAARPLLEQVAAMADCIGAQTVGQVTAISNRAAVWLRENPPGRPAAIEPRGCPTPGACSCVEPALPAPQAGEVQPPQPTFLDAIRLAQGCHDYSGGHSGQQGEAFQDGVGTVVAVLKKAAVGPWDSQTMAVFAVGSAPRAGGGEA